MMLLDTIFLISLFCLTCFVTWKLFRKMDKVVEKRWGQSGKIWAGRIVAVASFFLNVFVGNMILAWAMIGAFVFSCIILPPWKMQKIRAKDKIMLEADKELYKLNAKLNNTTDPTELQQIKIEAKQIESKLNDKLIELEKLYSKKGKNNA